MQSLVSKLLLLERKIDATEADGKKLKCKYYKWKYNRCYKKLGKQLRKRAGR